LILADKREKLRETLVGRSPGVPPQSLRALLAGRDVRVHAVLTGPVDTDMSRDLDIAKASPESVARAIFDGVEKGEEEIFPDPMSESMAESWRSGAAKALER
jgi:short-subunit dehydrogenase